MGKINNRPRPPPEHQITRDFRRAIAENNTKEIIKLYSKKINLDHTHQGKTFLGLAISNKNYSTTKLLLLLGAPADQRSKFIIRTKSGICTRVHIQYETPLIMSIDMNLENITQELIKSGADLNRDGHMGIQPLQLASLKQNPNLVRTLLYNGSQINFPNYHNNPLCIVSQFLRHQIQISGFKDEHFITAKRDLHSELYNYSELYKQRETLIELISAGINNSIKGIDNLSPTMWCIKHADIGILELLIEAGAKPDIRNPWLLVPNLPIQWQGSPEITSWLINEASSPSPLERLARTCIRNNIRNKTNKDVRLSIHKLPLPTPLKLDLKLENQSLKALLTPPSTPWTDIRLPQDYWEEQRNKPLRYIPQDSTIKANKEKTNNIPPNRLNKTIETYFPSSRQITDKRPPPILYYFDPKPSSNKHYFSSYNDA